MLDMKRKFTLALAGVIGAVSLGGLCACDNGTAVKSYSQTYYAMGTYATLTVSKKGFSQAKFDELHNEVEKFLTEAENSLSASVTGSCIYEFNGAYAGEKIEIDKTTYEVLGEALSLCDFTGGKFNPAVWHNANAYHLAVQEDDGEQFKYVKEGYALPDEKYIEAFNELSAQFYEFTYLDESEGKYYVTKPPRLVTVEGDATRYGTRIDLGGIAKGWCADRVNEMMTAAGVRYGYFNFGRSSIAIKKYAGVWGGVYVVGGRDPRSAAGDEFFSIKAKDTMLSTSGDYEKYYELDGVRYCHLIDPSTGKPIQTGVASVTVIGEGCARTDALTTALSAMDKQSAVNFINGKLTGYKVIMLYLEDGAGKVITNCPEDIKITNPDYTVINTVADGKIVLN